eukprot:COSAG01_NODE_3131_length_6533_cov_6.407212_3_plen_147_part_00
MMLLDQVVTGGGSSGGKQQVADWVQLRSNGLWVPAQFLRACTDADAEASAEEQAAAAAAGVEGPGSAQAPSYRGPGESEELFDMLHELSVSVMHLIAAGLVCARARVCADDEPAGWGRQPRGCLGCTRSILSEIYLCHACSCHEMW